MNPDSAVAKKYGKSGQIRFFNDQPIVPLAYCRHRNPVKKRRYFSRFTPEGRDEIHKKPGIDLTVLFNLMNSRISEEQTIEFVNNRISRYCAQYGKCQITGIHLSEDEINCHHVLPRQLGDDDSYDNLIIIHMDVHKLIHTGNI